MPQQPESNPPTPPAETPPQVPDISAPTVEELNATLQAERMRAMQLEADRGRLEQALWSRREQAPAPPQTADPYERFSENVLTGDPKENTNVLRTAVRGDINRVGQQVRNEVNNALNQQRVEFEAQRALDKVTMRFPELMDPANQSKFAGLITKAQVDAQAQGLQLNMDQIADRAAREYGTLYGNRQPTRVPHVEGATPPGFAPPTNNPNEPAVKNGLEEAYGMEVGTIEPINPVAMKGITRGYVKDKNAYIRKKGTGSSLIINSVTEAT